MARIRNIKPDVFKDEDLAELPIAFRWLFVGLWGLADARGILDYSPKRVMIEVLPFDGIPWAEVEAMVRILEGKKQATPIQGTSGTGKPYLQRYEVGGRQFLRVLRFNRHQRPSKEEWATLARAIADGRAHPPPPGPPPPVGWPWEETLAPFLTELDRRQKPRKKRETPPESDDGTQEGHEGDEPGAHGGAHEGAPPVAHGGAPPTKRQEIADAAGPAPGGATGGPGGSAPPGETPGRGRGTESGIRGVEGKKESGDGKGGPGGESPGTCPRSYPQCPQGEGEEEGKGRDGEAKGEGREPVKGTGPQWRGTADPKDLDRLLSGPPRDQIDEDARKWAAELLRLARNPGRAFEGPWPHPRIPETMRSLVRGGWGAFCTLQEATSARLAHIVGMALAEGDRKGWKKQGLGKGAT